MVSKPITFEVHITVLGNQDKWIEFCHSVNIQPIIIKLSHGAIPLQLMCAAYIRTHFRNLTEKIEKLTHKMQQAGFRIIRVKPECSLHYVDQVPEPAYYESHIKIYGNEADAGKISRIASAAGLYESRSLLSKNPNIKKWFMSDRQYGGTVRQARAKFMRAADKVGDQVKIRGLELEAVIYDTNPMIDEGWIDKKRPLRV